MSESTATTSLRAGWYAVAVLWLAYICSFVDRQVLALLVDPIKTSLAIGAANFLMALPSGASVAAISEVTPAALRGRVSAIYYLVMSLVGLAAGPLSVALCTDYLFRDPARVGDSISVVSAVIGPLAACLIWRALPEFRRWAAEAG